MIDKIKNNILLIILVLITLVVCILNYTPGTFLSGWDTLHPEFNFGLSINREISGVFRENQGLGAIAGHSDMADLPHILILYIFHFFLPLNFLRYAYVFLALIIGVLGMYIFLNKLILKNKTASFLGGLFYLLNLGTMQQFVVPFEMFITQYATLPWLFFFATIFILHNSKKRYIFFFALTTLLATPIAFAATLWYFQFFIFILYCLFLTFDQILKRSLVKAKKVFILIAITLLINSFWILPNLYFVTNYGTNVQNAKINKIFSKEAFLYNKEFGNVKDLSLLKNFLFDWSVYSGNNDFTQLLSPWINHLKKPLVEQIGFLFGLMSFIGLIYSIKTKNKILIAIISPLLFSLFFLINDNPPTSYLYNSLKNMPLFSEAFRFPQNKVLGIFIFAFAVYFAISQLIIIKILKTRAIKSAYVFLLLILVIYFMFPAFKGNFISSYMKIEIPKEYFQLFEWFNKQDPNARIANLPIHSQWGWEYYNWYENQKPSFQGAGFTWFGIKQPILNRDFDRWDPANEQYYREMSHAIYSKDLIKLTNVLQKYNISYILVDKNNIDPERGNSKTLFLSEIEVLFNKSPVIQKVANFENLFVYQTTFDKKNVRVIKNPPSVNPQVSAFYDDFPYSKYKDYIAYTDSKKDIITYPFRNIIDNQNILISKIILPSYQDKTIHKDITNGQSLNECQNALEDSKSKKDIIEENSEKFVRYSSLSGSFCEHYVFQNLPRNQAYLISITSRNIKGLPLKLCAVNYVSQRCDLYTQLDSSRTFKETVFLLPPLDNSVGFYIHINNFAITKSPSVNDLKSIKVTPFPYNELSQVEEYTPISDSSKETDVIVLSQSFDKGWKAYEIANSKWQMTNSFKTFFPFLFGKELKEHVLVNNWSNGWVIPESSVISNHSSLIIIFWPQYLEYLGFTLLIGTFAWLAVKMRP